MTGRGRPLRFLMLVTSGWIGLRFALLWQQTGSLPVAIRQAVPLPRAIAMPPPAALPGTGRVVMAVPPPRPAVERLAAAVPPATERRDPIRFQLALLSAAPLGTATPLQADDMEPQALPPTPPATPGLATAAPRTRAGLALTRWSGSSWAILRGGTGIGASADAGQLGGSQGGIRADYAIGGGLALTGRLASPAAGAGREVSAGIAWRPGALPVRLVAEQRIALDDGRGGPSLGISGGVSEMPLPARFRLEGYAQGGAILRDGVERYVDGIVRAARPLGQAGAIRFDIGAGAWGGAQRGVARLDVGPSIGVRVPLADRTLRVALDWRQRVAGNARPGSGPALSLGADF